MYTDGAATSATGNSPVFTSASYNFVSGDALAWVYVNPGGAWTGGWSQILSVSAGAATLSAAIGAAVLSNYTPNTVAGIANTASPTGATWSIDYSQQSSAQFTYTDLTGVGAGLLLSSAAFPFGKQQVGNGLLTTGGTNVTAERIVLASVAAGVGTFVGPANVTTGATVNGTGVMGGALASPGQAGAVMVAGNDLFVKSNGVTAYTVASASSNVSTGCLTLPAGASAANATKMIGYGSVRGDNGTKPIVKANGSITTFTLVTSGTDNVISNVAVDGNSRTGSSGITVGNATLLLRCTVANCVSRGIGGGGTSGITLFCSVTGCGASPFLIAGILYGCVAYSNTTSGFTSNSSNVFAGCYSVNNSGASSDGFTINGNIAQSIGCVAYGNGRDGFRVTAGQAVKTLLNCYAEGNAGWGFNGTAADDSTYLFNCGGYLNTSGNVNTSVLTNPAFNFATLSASGFNNAAGLDFSLNATASAGALLRAAGIPGSSGLFTLPGLSTLSYPDLGGAQHQTITSVLLAMGMGGGMRG